VSRRPGAYAHDLGARSSPYKFFTALCRLYIVFRPPGNPNDSYLSLAQAPSSAAWLVFHLQGPRLLGDSLLRFTSKAKPTFAKLRSKVALKVL